MLRYVIHFAGHVQGVGFRYTAREIAQNYPVVGYVENLPDGRVRLVAEGDPEHLDALVAAIHQAMKRHVHQHTVAKEPPTGEFGTPGVDDLTIRR